MNDLSVLISTPAIVLVPLLLPICSYFISYLYEWGKTCQRGSKPPYSGATAGIIHTKWMFNFVHFQDRHTYSSIVRSLVSYNSVLEILCSFDKDFRMFSKLQPMGYQFQRVEDLFIIAKLYTARPLCMTYQFRTGEIFGQLQFCTWCFWHLSTNNLFFLRTSTDGILIPTYVKDVLM